MYSESLYVLEKLLQMWCLFVIVKFSWCLLLVYTGVFFFSHEVGFFSNECFPLPVLWKYQVIKLNLRNARYLVIIHVNIFQTQGRLLMFTVYSFIDFTFIVLHSGSCKLLYVTLVCGLVKVTQTEKTLVKFNFSERESAWISLKKLGF